MTAKPKFPLAKKYFSPVELAPDETDDYRRTVRHCVARALRDEHDFVHVYHRKVDASQWQPVKQQKQFQVFKRKRNSFGSQFSSGKESKPGFGRVEGSLDEVLYGWYNQSNTELELTLSLMDSDHKKRTDSNVSTLSSVSSFNGDLMERKPSMLGFGIVDGTLDDILYGWHNHSHEEIKATQSFMGESTADATILHTIDTATITDPFHHIGMKWALAKVSVLHPRDYCYIDAMGMSLDRNGNRYAYIIMHSIESDSCPPFPKGIAIRAQLSFAFILREQQPGKVTVFSQGHVEAGGEMIEGLQVSTVLTAETLLRMFDAVKCGEAKKLTLMAAYNNMRGVEPIILDSYAQKGKKEMCYMCKKTSGMFKSRLRTCRICKATVCRKCCAQQFVFTAPNLAICKVTCCPTCIFRARYMEVRPNDEEFGLIENQHLLLREQFLSVLSSSENGRLSESSRWSESICSDNNDLLRMSMQSFYNTGPINGVDWSDSCSDSDSSGMESSYRSCSSVSSMDELWSSSDELDPLNHIKFSEDDMEAAVELVLRSRLAPVCRRLNADDINGMKEQLRGHVRSLQRDTLFQRLLVLHRTSREMTPAIAN